MPEKKTEPAWPAISEIRCIVFDFDGVFTDNKVYVDQNGKESVRCDRADGLGLDLLLDQLRGTSLAENIFILSKEKNPVVLARAEKLRLKCVHGVDNKLDYLNTYIAETSGLNTLDGLVYLGNDLNDLPVVLKAGFSVVPFDAHIKIKEIATVVLSSKGGCGFVRAFIEKLLGIDSMTPEEVNEFIYNS